jgi:hypothetical protein
MEKLLLEKFAYLALGATVCAMAPLHAASAGDPPADKPGAARLESSGTRLVIPDLHRRTLSVRPTTANALAGAAKTPSLAVSADLPYALSANGKVLAGLRKANGGGAMELVVFDVETAARVGGFTLAANELPDGVWVNSKGTAAGVFAQGRFVAYSLDGAAPPSKALFERPTSLFLASPSGRLIILATAAGSLLVIDSEHWRELPQAQDLIQQTVRQWLTSRKLRPESTQADGPFAFPVQPVDITADDRLMSVSLGENASTFLNICMSSGQLVSSVVFDKRVNATPRFSNSGRLFSVQVVPNTDDPSFRRPANDFGLRIYSSYSGQHLSTLPIPARDWARYAKTGAKYFLEDWPGWLGFTAGDKAVLRIEGASQAPRAQPMGFMEDRLKDSAQAHPGCAPLGR